MQIVIDIPKKLYNRYKVKDHIKRCDIDEFEKALDRCIILPKGHGRIGDLDELTQRITNYIKYNEHMMDEFTLLQEKFILEGIKDTPTIIEADKIRGE